MSIEGEYESELGDYDDAPGRGSGHPLIRVLRAAGAFVTVGLGATITVVVALRIDLALEFFLGCAVLSFASIPLIMLFWSQEIGWKGGWLSSSVSVIVISVLTWVAEVLFSAIMLIFFLNLIR